MLDFLSHNVSAFRVIGSKIFSSNVISACCTILGRKLNFNADNLKAMIKRFTTRRKQLYFLHIFSIVRAKKRKERGNVMFLGPNEKLSTRILINRKFRVF